MNNMNRAVQVAMLALLSWMAVCSCKEDVVDVVVVGAGISGLTAAIKLRNAGLSVAVLEAQAQVGGRLQRTRVQNGNATAAWIDLGGQWVGDTQTRLLALAQELGVKTFPTPKQGQDVFYFGGRRTVHNKHFPVPPYVIQELRSPWLNYNFSMSERDDLVHTWLKVEALAAAVDAEAPWTSPNALKLDSMTIASWLEDNTNTNMAKWFVEIMAAMGGSGGFEASQASMLHLAWTQRVAPQSEIPEGHLFDGGAAQFPAALAAKLGSAIHTKRPVWKITQNQAAGTVTAHTPRGKYTGRAAVVAMPPHLTGRIAYEPAMPPMRDQLTQRAPMGTIIKVFAIYDRPWWREAGLSGTAAGDLTSLEFVADSTNPRPGSPGVLASFITGSAATILGELPLEVRRAVVLEDLVTLFGPQARFVTEYREGNWPANTWSGGAFTTFFTPGTWTEFGPALRRPVGRIFWAGTEMATKWPGYIDGGIRAGEAAAQDVINMLRVDQQPAVATS